MNYDFRCAECGKEFSKEMTLRTYSTSKIVSCPHCGSIATIRIIIFPPPVIYKGDGFTKKVEDDSAG